MGKKNRNQVNQDTELTQEEVVVQKEPEVEVQPEVQKEVKEVQQEQPVEPKKEEQPKAKKEQAKVELSSDEESNVIAKILSDSKLDNKAKFEAICTSGTKYSLLALNLKSYQDKMGKSSPVPTGLDGAANNYNLYNILISIANTPIYTDFKLKFDIVNLCFLAYSDDAYSEFKLFRYSLEWKYGKDKYLTYRSLAILICMLCNKSTRAEALKKIVISKALTLDGTKFTETAIQNVKRYYES